MYCSQTKLVFSLLVKDKVYSITLPNKAKFMIQLELGIFFVLHLLVQCLKKRTFCGHYALPGGAAQAALESRNLGLQKIPQKGAVQTNASYFYNLVTFRSL